MAPFYKSFYFIINALINSVVKVCSEMPVTMGSGFIEAGKLAASCTIRVSTERYFSL